jgi:uncharacterized SAM-binding protein YcdF (DUF218 family)
MFFALSKILQFLAYPLPLCILVLLGIVIFYHRSWARKGLLIVLVFLYSLSVPYTADRLMQWLEVPRVDTAVLRPPYDTVIVLSGMLHHASVRKGHIEFSEAADRIVAGIILVQQGLGQTLLLSGGSGNLFDQSASESRLLKTFALQFGLRDDQILLEPDSRSTYENALYTAKMLRDNQWHHVVLVTSALHMRRALATFHQQGIFPDVYPVDYHATDVITPFSFLPSAGGLAKVTTVIHELIGLIAYWVQGYI